MDFTEAQMNYLEVIGGILKTIVKKYNMEQEYFEANFRELFDIAHETYQNFLQKAINDEKFKKEVLEEIWKEIRTKQNEKHN